jgi:hypothetical protein
MITCLANTDWDEEKWEKKYNCLGNDAAAVDTADTAADTEW